MKLSVLMPVYNEFATLSGAVKAVLAVDYPCEMELVIVDDGSTDGTRELYSAFEFDPRVRVLLHEANRGKGAAIRTAAEAATGDYIIMCDADLEYSPDDIPALLAVVMRGDADVVYGTRSFGSHTAYSYWYVLGNRFVTTAANVLFNCYISDLETCFKLLSRDLYLALDVSRRGFGMEAEVTGKLLRRGIRPYEVPVDYKARSRAEGKKLTARDGVEALWILGRERVSRVTAGDPGAAGAGPTGWLRWEYWLVALLAGLTCVVHDVAYMLSTPFWGDEAWVAVTTRFPVGQLPLVTASTPIGWSLLLRPFTLVGGPESLRLLPLIFSALTIVAAYVLGRGLGWLARWQAIASGTLAATAALMSPAMLIRSDLKQYTADACLAMVVLVILSRLERQWTRRRLAALVTVVPCGMLLSHTTLFVGAAAFAAVCAVQLSRRAWPRLAETAVAGLAAGFTTGVVYWLFDARAVVPGLVRFWANYYVPLYQGPHGILRFVHFHLEHEGVADTGLGRVWLMGALTALGLVVLVRVARPSIAAAYILLGLELAIVSALRKYPLFNDRIGTFLWLLWTVLAAVGVAGLCAWIAGRQWESQRRRLRAARPVGSAVLAMTALVAFSVGVADKIRSHWNPYEDVPGQIAYIQVHRRADDMILLSSASIRAFAYYTRTPITHVYNRNSLVTYEPVLVGQRQIVASKGIGGIQRSTDQAVTWMKQHPGSRIWFITQRMAEREHAAWDRAFTAYGLEAQPVEQAETQAPARARPGTGLTELMMLHPIPARNR